MDRYSWVVSGTFTVDGATHEPSFTSDGELGRFLDFLLAARRKPDTSRLYLRPNRTSLRA